MAGGIMSTFDEAEAQTRADIEAGRDVRGEFTVVQFFPDETYEKVLEFAGPKEAVECAKRLSVSVGGQIGTTRRIIITDGDDCTVFEWKFGAGVVYPPPNGKGGYG